LKTRLNILLQRASLIITFISFLFLSCNVWAACRVHTSAQRIISLAPDLTEILFAIGAGDQVIAVSAGSDYPEKARQLPQVGNDRTLNIEQILMLKPDLIVTFGKGHERALSALADLAIPVYHHAPTKLQEVSRSIRYLGCLTGKIAKANVLAWQYEKELQTLKKNNQPLTPVRVFYQIGPYPKYTINQESWIDEAISFCGGVNVFHSLPFKRLQVDWEAILAADPEVVVSDTAGVQWKQPWRAFRTINAVKQGRLYTINPDWLERAGPRLPLGVKQLCAAIRDESRKSEPRP
jgi:ABC-type Fe3+-hydroxamate transport system substrate-binding protein